MKFILSAMICSCLISANAQFYDSAVLKINMDYIQEYIHDSDQYLFSILEDLDVSDVQLSDDLNLRALKASISPRTDTTINEFDLDLVIGDNNYFLWLECFDCVLKAEGLIYAQTAPGKLANFETITISVPINVMRVYIDFTSYTGPNSLTKGIQIVYEYDDLVIESGIVLDQSQKDRTMKHLQQDIQKQATMALDDIYHQRNFYKWDIDVLNSLSRVHSLIYLMFKADVLNIYDKVVAIGSILYPSHYQIRRLQEIHQPTFYSQHSLSEYPYQIRLDENFINSALGYFIYKYRSFSLKHLPTSSISDEQFTTKHLHKLLPQLIEEYGPDAPFDIVFDFSDNLLSKNLDLKNQQKSCNSYLNVNEDGNIAEELNGLSMNQNNEYILRLRTSAHLRVQKDDSLWEEARTMKMNLLLKFQMTLENEESDFPQLSIDHIFIQTSNFRILKDGIDQMHEQRLAGSQLNERLSLLSSGPLKVPLYQPFQSKHLNCLGVTIKKVMIYPLGQFLQINSLITKYDMYADDDGEEYVEGYATDYNEGFDDEFCYDSSYNLITKPEEWLENLAFAGVLYLSELITQI